ncbi:hypothetical protein [Streptomyces sp. RKAG293]|uniref:hypothetical protein n=1 Tax=Streptomyces sp. RKAG293 TaxID=2893403 RepID=UPI002033B5CC|nr:hypothetical protein [Streptomyces sp. RKAG293]MCM2416555.1 hypothetical protein [Streptomyces sp. RKAG293]
MDYLSHWMHAHPANERILAWLRVGPDDRLKPFHGISIDEGGVALFYKYGRDLPETCKWSLGINNVMVHPVTGVIFAVHYGRFTFLVRWYGVPTRQNDTAETYDGTIDLRPLEHEWWSWSYYGFDEEIADLHEAYARAEHG